MMGDLVRLKEWRAKVVGAVRGARPPPQHIQGDDFGARLVRIRDSLDRINALMLELSDKSKGELSDGHNDSGGGTGSHTDSERT